MALRADAEMSPVPAAAEASPPLRCGPTLAAMRDLIRDLAHDRRMPDEDEASRWRMHAIGGRVHRMVQPISFTPYAAARACSARCRFCSETLRSDEAGTAAAALRPRPDYFEALRGALAQLRGLPLSYSLSGLETTDDAAWCRSMLRVLDAAARDGVAVAERVLYSNGAGFAHAHGDALIEAFGEFGLSWVELSRHHMNPERNQAIMRFRAGEPIADDATFAATARRLARNLPLRLICIVQGGGIEDAQGVAEYLAWAKALGAGTVIFREFSRLDARYRETGSRRYIDSTRVSIETLIAACMDAPWWPTLTPYAVTEGYYFWNLRLRTRDGVEVVFESSDYAVMRHRHASDAIYKLVFHANGRLCAGWSPDRDVLWSHADG